ncbi:MULTISPECIES: hypothetical protein [Chryseobacterium]|uniref:Glycosyltransferase family 1 protein n=1 Tax=Chryseobacterium camelliae TaxID=1265445 RepID=A0ABU0TJC2_9FLAO|nr:MULTISPECIES: hypothetical protein [Chryseobacterium]MDT3408981.1 hypothetical protein [Pseudacidovorax intermedius]MDQ1097162.1 hypothetical protein [Chryseobacterium camelliae]MDQ1101099.1 hypothetical protein [Chryseobacterium sp. SORGH_AS_1048]MDR6084542.1 hypothetical protein [Chryseobacterium sp. SORGH_AS_0909]MDR6132811.1 hypothetical protein [Chryseobacterium sp. SORGH_AS_1175]
MKKLAYIELDTHAEIAQNFADVMQGSTEFTIDYYFSEKIYRQFSTVETENMILSDSSLILDQLKTKKYDLIIIGTVHRYFNTFKTLTERYRTAIIVHNLNFSVASSFVLLKSIFSADRIYRLKLFLKEGLLLAGKVYQAAEKLLVLDPALSSGRYLYLPLFYTKGIQRLEDKILTIVIPGGVSQQRRDYRRVFKMIREWENTFRNGSAPAQPIEFVFLGKAPGSSLHDLTDLERSLENISIRYFRERVSRADFEAWMQKADVLWCPVQRKTEFFSQEEQYGTTKMTGNIGDAITYGRPAVFPPGYPSSLGFIVPEEQGLLQQLNHLKQYDFDFEKYYSLKKIRTDLENLLKNLTT